MIQFTKKVSLVVFVLTVAWFGIYFGQHLSRQIAAVTVHAAATGQSPSVPAVVSKQERYENLELFQKVLHYVEGNYVTEVKNKDLVYGAIKGMLETLDPHSNFLTPDIFKDMKTETSGKFGGLGIEIGLKDGILTIMSPIEDTPAWNAGLKPYDRIVKINKESTKGMNLIEAVSKMRGKKGTDVTLSIFRDGWEKVREITITRDIIKIQAVKSEELEPSIGYVRITTFNESTASDTKKAIQKLEAKQKLKGLVLDMRTNPGGLLDQAVEVSSLFIDEGIVVSTIGRNPNIKDVKHAKKGNARKDFPVAILVSSSTASAAEIVAGALQDNNRAIVMGQPTFGKGSVQQVIELGPDLGLKLTIARYYTPSGRSIQEKGVQPDVLLEDFDPKLLAEARRKQDYFREKDLKGHMLNEDGSPNEEPTDSSTEKASDKKVRKDFKKEELDAISGKKGKPSKTEEEDLAPIKFNAKEDFQVKEAVNYLKSIDVIKRLNSASAGSAPAVTQAKK